MEGMGRLESMKPTSSSRGYLLLLQIMFLVLLGNQYPLPITRVQGVYMIVLAILTLLLLTVPRTQLTTGWFLSLLTLGNASILFATAISTTVQAPELWILVALVLLLAMASYVSCLLHFALLNSLVISGYGLLLHHLGALQTEKVLLLPALLCLTLVFLSKISLTQAEIRRLTETEEYTRTKSMCDALTGLPNRAQFLERVGRAVQCQQNNRDASFALLFVDLDGFKPINDQLGHKAGDAVLRQTARVFQGCLRKGDIVARYGGDEFTFLLHNVKGPTDAIRVAERILTKVQTPIDVGEPVKVGASIGIALSTNLHERPEDLIRDADGAMYRAKAEGKNRYFLSDQSSDVSKTELKARWKRIAHLGWNRA
jgi:diguanylate cyclase (GGDEF)-like protein